MQNIVQIDSSGISSSLNNTVADMREQIIPVSSCPTFVANLSSIIIIGVMSAFLSPFMVRTGNKVISVVREKENE